MATPTLLPADADPADVTVNLFYNKGGELPEVYVTTLDQLLALSAGAVGGVRGEAVLVGGTVTVPKTLITATSTILLSRRLIGGTVGNMSFTRSAGVSFTINSSSGTDTSTIQYFIIP